MILKQDFQHKGSSEKFILGNIFYSLEHNLNELQALFVYHICI